MEAKPPSHQPTNTDFWSEVRSHFRTAPGLAYLNCAAWGTPPQQVLDAVAEGYLRLSARPEVHRNEQGQYVEETLRPLAGQMMGADPDEIAFLRNAGEALDLIAAAVNGLQPGDEILTTSQEHPTGIGPWRARAERDGVVIREVPIPSPLTSHEDLLERMRAAITERTRVLLFCHVTRGGNLYPLAEMCALAREHGLLSVVDGAQALARVPVNLDAAGCDLYAVSMHKWLLGPSGSGALFVRRELQDAFGRPDTPPGGTAAKRYEISGTFDSPTRLGMAAAIELNNNIGLDSIVARNYHLADRLREGLEALPGDRVRVVSAAEHDLRAPGSTLCEVDGTPAGEIRGTLRQQYDISVDDHVRDGHDALRISTHFFNTEEEVDRLTAAIGEVAGAAYAGGGGASDGERVE